MTNPDIIKKLKLLRDEMEAKSQSDGVWHLMPMTLGQLRRGVYRSFVQQLGEILGTAEIP